MSTRADEPGPDRNDPIADAAAQWIAQRGEGLTPAQERALAQWRRADPRHEAAFARLERAHALLERLPFAADHLADLRAPAAVPAKPRRWIAWAGASAAAAAIIVAATVWRARPAPAPAAGTDYATSAGGYERVLLSDGSTLELNADSAARVQFAAGERRVTLLAGEAHFTVARDAARPFVVAAGGVAVRAVGTAFNVRLAPAGVEVLVTHGQVALAHAGDGRPETGDGKTASGLPSPASLLSAGQRAVLERAAPAAAPRIEAVAPAAMAQALAWQERKLVFADTPLHEVAAQFNRRNRTQLTLGDPALAARPVGGTFAADNVEAFVRLLETAGDITATPRGEREIVLQRRP